MANLRILKRDLVKNNNSLSVIAGATNSTYPLINLIDPSKFKVWRSTNLSLPTIQVTWSAAQSINCVVSTFTNLISGSQVRIRLYDDPVAGALLYDSNNVTITHSYEPPEGFTTLGLAALSFGGGVHFSKFFDQIDNVRRLTVQYNSSGNPDAYVEVSHLLAGLSFEPEDNADYGARFGYEDNTKAVRTSAGSLITDRGTIYRILDFGIENMSLSDKSNIEKIFRSVGKSQKVFVSLLPSDNFDSTSVSGQIYGVLENNLSIIYAAFNLFSSDFRIVEI